MRKLGPHCLMLALVVAAGPAAASSEGLGIMKRWTAMDRCASEAQQAFPDYSADAYAKRDARLRDCLERNHLPPRAPLVPSH